MRKAKGFLSIFAGLALLFQAGTTAVFADDGSVHGNVGAQAQAALETSMKNAEKAAAQIATTIAAAQLSLHSGTLNVTRELALNATAQAAMSAQKELAAALAAAQNPRTALSNAINAGNAAEIAAAAEAAQQAAASLNAAANTATQANANLNTTANALGTTSATTTIVNGVQTLPSTSTGDNFPLTALGGVLFSIGVWLLRRPRETSPDS